MIVLTSLAVGLYAFVYFKSAFAQSENVTSQATETIRDSEQPIEVAADDALEWDRENKKYTAQGNASAIQGDTSVHAETLVADYKENPQGRINIWRLTARTGVELRSPEGTVYGEKAVYMIEQGRAEVTGNNLKLVSPEQTITAKDNFLYFTNKNHFVANGDVIVKRDGDTLKADQITATFRNDKNGQRPLDQMEASGNVIIITPEETLSGRVATYDPQTEIAELVGNVKIIQGPNLLIGNRATVDLKTKISRIYGSPNAGERVKGLFFPGINDEKNQSTNGSENTPGTADGDKS